MADNTRLNKGQGGDLIRTVDEGSVKTQAVALMGTQDNGRLAYIPSTPEGHAEIAIHSPRLPFGSLHTELLAPVFQNDGVYGVNGFGIIQSTGLSFGTGSNSGAVTGTNNKIVVSTGTTQYSFASVQSRRRLRYKAGQGVVGRFAGFFTGAVANSILVAGFGTAETTLAFGYNGTQFGILYSTGGVREIHTFTVTTASTSTQPYNVTLPNTATVNVTATNNSSTTRTAYEISQGTFPGWKAASRGATVIFVADSAGNKSGSFSLAQSGAGTPAAGTDSETLAGSASTDTWIYQSAWNGDVMDGSGSASNPSGFNLDPTKGNVYQIGVQYLGFGSISFQVEAYSGSNNPEFVTVHTIRYPNTATETSMSQPAFPFLAAAYSAGSTTNCSVSIGSFAGFNEGVQTNLGPRSSYSRDSTVTTSTTVFVPIITVRNGLTFNGRVNQSVIHLLDVSGDTQGNANSRTKFYLVRNAALTGPVNFTAWGSTSCSYVDVGATGMATPTNTDIIFTRTLGQTNDFEYAFSDREITLQPGETATLCVKSLGATATCTGGFNAREDQ